MGLRGVGVGVFGALAVSSLVVAGSVVWLVVTDPVTVANSVNEGDISPLVRSLAAAILQALQGLFQYL
jgi:hypothetical protein